MTFADFPEKIFILIPSYQSAKPLAEFLARLLKVVPASHVCVVDDASTDGTENVCEKAGVTCLSHSVNMGKGAALQTGFEYVERQGAQWVITMDADGQHSPDDLPGFFKAAADSSDCALCIGCRSMKPGKMPLSRILSNRITSGILSFLTGNRILDSQCGYRLYSMRFLKAITLDFNRFEMESEVIIKACMLKFPVLFIPVQTLYLGDRSHISHHKDTMRWIAAVVKIWLQRKYIIGKYST